MCRVLEVSRNGFYGWVKRRESKRRKEDRELLERIRAIHKKSRGIYGRRRVHRVLREEGIHVGEKRVGRLMRAAGLRGKCRRKFRPKTTDSNHGKRTFPNQLPEAVIERPDQVWAADITYIGTDAGWVYLATVIDLCSRTIVGWSMARTLATELPLQALRMALSWRRAPELHHSDQGSQYASDDYRELLEDFGIDGSMSRKGNCYDNAIQESFYHSLKTEHVFHEDYENEEAFRSIADYIEVFYNRERRHSSLNYMSPAQFERWVAA